MAVPKAILWIRFKPWVVHKHESCIYWRKGADKVHLKMGLSLDSHIRKDGGGGTMGMQAKSVTLVSTISR